MAIYFMHPSSIRRTTLAARANSTAYTAGQQVKSVTATDRFVLTCVVGGTSAAAPPTYSPVYGNTVVDGGVTWRYENTGVHDLINPDKAAWNLMDAWDSTAAPTYNQGDSLVALTDGVTAYAVPASFSTVSTADFKIASRNYANAPTISCAIFDFGGAARSITIAGGFQTFNQLHFKNSTSTPVSFSGDSFTFNKCRFSGNSGYGVTVAAGAEGSHFSACHFYNNTSGGVNYGEVTSGGSMDGCYFYGNTGPAIVCGTVRLVNCVIFGSGGANGTCVTASYNGRFSLIHCTLYVSAPFTATNGAVSVGNVYAMGIIQDCYIYGAVGSGGAAGTCKAIYAGSNNTVNGQFCSIKNNRYYNCDGDVSSCVSANCTDYEPMVNAQLTFNNAAAGDFEPTTDTSALTATNRIAEESPWMGYGAIPFTPAASAAGGVSRARLLNSGGF